MIHGAGGEAWRSDDPKSKFVIINIPLRKLRSGVCSSARSRSMPSSPRKPTRAQAIPSYFGMESSTNISLWVAPPTSTSTVFRLPGTNRPDLQALSEMHAAVDHFESQCGVRTQRSLVID